MSRDRWFRGGDEAAAFDWYRPARDLDLPIEIARALYQRAMQLAGDTNARRAEELYRRWLREAAAERRPAHVATPGRRTRVMREAGRAERARHQPDRAERAERAERGLLDPGRWTRALLEADHAQAASQSGTPGFEDVQLAMGGLIGSGLTSTREPLVRPPAGTVAALREQLVAAAERGRGVAKVLAEAEPAIAAAALRELRGAPVLRLLAKADDGGAGRALGQGSEGVPLPGDIAARLRPHVGAEATDAARLHTDDTADLVATAHHARAVALGDAIYFRRGEFAPGTERGDELLAHELTHVAQARRGEITRAAAKGIDSGGTLDPGEAEADLRAKLAVIELHPAQTQPPPLAQPSGQPTSDGDRQAKIAAQQQRLTLAGTPAPTGQDVQTPPASKPQTPVAHQPPKMGAPPRPASTGNAYVDTFMAPPSKQATELWDKAGSKATTQVAADQAKFDAGLPPLPVTLDGGDAKGAKGGGPGHNPKAPPPKGATPPPVQAQPTPLPPPVTAGATAAKNVKPTDDKAQLKADGSKVIDNLPTSSPDVKTDPGPAPITDLAGQGDPVRVLGDQQHADQEGAKALEAEKQKVIAGPGAAQVQPVKLDEKLSVPKEGAPGTMPALPPVEGMVKLKKWNLPPDAQGAFDQIAKPKMDAHLANAKTQMTQAETKRDADRTKAIDDAQDKVKQAHADADKQQQTKVADTRTQIANHQADTLLKQEKHVKELDKQAGDKKQGTIGKINTRIAADQAKVESDYKDAQKQAEDKKKQGDADAEKKKKEAQEKKDHESWWEKAADTVCDAIKEIADELDKMLDAVCKAIGDLLDKIKDVACKVIDAARDFVCQALTEFGDWLKSAVTALIGSVFPELAAELNRLIDSAVNAAKAAVNAIADGLKKAVTALCDQLKGAIEAAIAAFKAAVQAAATLAQAVITGDWALVARMVLEGILKLLGIDPAAFYALIGKAMDSIDKIIENPGAFVGHLVDAVKLGFKQFGANFWTHLKDGLVQWLFGTFASAGIHMPASFDIAGIFDLVCQVLGLTWPRMRGKVVKIIGEKNTERLEFVAKYIQALITGGFSGLWAQVQQDMGGLWDMVVNGVKDWIIQKVVQQAIIKIATMWNPAGAIIQLIQTAWNVYQWVRENAQRIFGLVQAVVDSISNIVAGNITGAANFIEASLAKLVPIAISLFADLIGLGGIADKIKGIIEKVQTKVDNAIDKLIERVMKLFKGKDGKGDGDKKDGDHSVGDTITFEAAGHAHKLWFEVKGTQATLMVASTPVAVSTHLGHMQGQVDKLPDDKKSNAKALLGQAQAAESKATAEANKATHADGNAKDTADGKAAGSDEHTVADLLKQLFEIFEGLNAEDLKGACDKAGGMAKTKFGQVMAEGQPGAAAVRPAFLAGANVRLKPAPEKPLEAMRGEVSESGDKYILKGDPIPVAEIIGQQGISRVLDLPSVFNYYLDAGYKSRLKLTSADDFLKVCAEGKFNPQTDLNNAAEIRGKVAESWWFAKARAGGVTLGQIKKDLTVMDTTYDKGMLRLNITAAELAAANITLHKPTAFDGLMQGWGDDPMWVAAPSSPWGLTRDGMQEGVIKASQLGVFKDRKLILPEPMPAVDEVPESLTISGLAKLDKLPAGLADEIAKAANGTVIWQASVTDPKQVTTNLLHAHPDARFDKQSKNLQLPPTQAAALEAATSLAQLGAMIGQQTGVSKVTLKKSSNGEFTLIGSINPEKEVASGTAGDPQVRLRDAIAATEALMDAPEATTDSVRQGLEPIRSKFQLASLELQKQGPHEWNVLAKINPQLPSNSKKIPSADELAAIRAESARIAELWRRNGVGDRFRAASPARRADILLDDNSYRRPGGDANAPEVRLGDLVEATAEPGLRQIAAETGGILLVQPSLYLGDAAGQPLGGRVDEIDFLLLGPSEVRLVSAKLRRGEFRLNVDRRKLELFQNVPDNPAAAQYIANYMGWDDRARMADRSRTASAVIQCAGMPPLRVGDFRSRYLNRERTQNIVIEPVAPHGQGETPTSPGYSLRITLTDLIDLYIKEIMRVL